MRDADSDFFEAGGDSLAAFQITAGVRDTLGMDVSTPFPPSSPAGRSAVTAKPPCATLRP